MFMQSAVPRTRRAAPAALDGHAARLARARAHVQRSARKRQGQGPAHVRLPRLSGFAVRGHRDVWRAGAGVGLCLWAKTRSRTSSCRAKLCGDSTPIMDCRSNADGLYEGKSRAEFVTRVDLHGSRSARRPERCANSMAEFERNIRAYALAKRSGKFPGAERGRAFGSHFSFRASAERAGAAC